MRLKRLILKNYLTYDEANIDLSKFRKALIVGIYNREDSDSNGAGKSNLLRGIPWCIWGINPDAETIDHNVKWGKDFCSVETDFEHDNKQVQIIRTRSLKSKSSTLDLIIDGVVSNGSSVTDTNNKIIELLGLDYNAYINSVYIRQEDVFSLANSKDKDQSRELLERVLGLNEYDIYYEESKSIIKDLDLKISSLLEFAAKHSEIDIEVENTESQIDACIKESDKINTELLAVVESLKSKKKDFDSIKENLISKQNMVTRFGDAEQLLIKMNTELLDLVFKAKNFKSSLDQKRSELLATVNTESDVKAEQESIEKTKTSNISLIASIEPIATDISLKKESIKELNDRLMSCGQKIMFYKESIESNNKKINESNEKINNPHIEFGSKCQHCFTDINENTVDHFRTHLRDSIVVLSSKIASDKLSAKEEIAKKDAITIELKLINDNIDGLSLEISSINKQIIPEQSIQYRENIIKDRFSSIKNAGIEIGIIDVGKDVAEWKSTVNAKKNDIKNKEQQILNLKSELATMDSFDDKSASALEIDISNLESSSDNLKQNLYRLNGTIENSKSVLFDFDIIKKQIDSERIAIEHNKNMVNTYKEISAAFSPEGIRHHILRNAIDDLEREANEMLPKVSKGRLSVSFKTKKEVIKSKTGKTEKLVFDVYINDGEKTLPFNAYSGGEKFRISFVIRVALSKLLLHRANSKLEFLVIDEAVSPLDMGGVEQMMSIINDLQNEFKTILVITHRTEMKKFFDDIITVYREEKGSRVES